MSSTESDGQNEGNSGKESDEDRRTFLKVALTVSAALAAGGVAAVAKSITNPVPSLASKPIVPAQFPRLKIANVRDLQRNQPIIFNYPLDNEPNIVVKLGQKAEAGVGSEEDIVAFSQICQHLGCVYAYQSQGSSPSCDPSYKADRPVGYCCCHGSVYDFLKGAQVIGGPSARPQPRVILEVDSSGDIYAKGMTPPSVFGHETGSSDVSADLQGGNPVG